MKHLHTANCSAKPQICPNSTTNLEHERLLASPAAGVAWVVEIAELPRRDNYSI
jgi:hypothetical protein